MKKLIFLLFLSPSIVLADDPQFYINGDQILNFATSPYQDFMCDAWNLNYGIWLPYTPGQISGFTVQIYSGSNNNLTLEYTKNYGAGACVYSGGGALLDDVATHGWDKNKLYFTRVTGYAMGHGFFTFDSNFFRLVY